MPNRSPSIPSSPITHYLIPVVWMLLIFMVSGTPSQQIPKLGTWDLLVKKGSHMLAYALLAVLWWRPLSQYFTSPTAVIVALAIAILYAISDEYHQTFVPGRNGSMTDVLVDSAGAVFGLTVWRWWVKRHF